MLKFSIVIPVYNEEESLPVLYQEIKQNCDRLDKTYEIIFVDDGSEDKSFEALKNIAVNDRAVKVIKFRKNFGQTAALSAGIDSAIGEVIIPMDADMQNDPQDIELLLSKIDEGFDAVSGWRKNRKDKIISRRLPSWSANTLISFITKVRLHDYGCTLKAYRSDIIKDIRLYGEMHRFIPAYASWKGAQVVEVVVNHRPRKFGKAKYGISRTMKVVLDLIVVKFIIDYSTRSIYFFGGLGFLSILGGLFSGFLAIYLRLFYEIPFISTPLLLLTVFLFMIGIQFIVMGLLSDIILRSYYETNKKKVYTIKEKINII